MKGIYIALTACFVVPALGYYGFRAINEHVDRESGTIVERTLAANTINQLAVLSEVESLVAAGEVDLARQKLVEATDTLVYILKENCALEKCEEALSIYERN